MISKRQWGSVILILLALFCGKILLIYKVEYPVEWHMINVNFHSQGDAHLLIDGARVLMVDAGEKYAADAKLIPYLRNLGVSKIDHFFVSHPHTDHFGGIRSLLESNISIENIYINLPPKGVSDWNYRPLEFLVLLEEAKLSGAQIIEINSDFRLDLPTTNLEVIAALKSARFENGKLPSVNDFSVVMRWNVGAHQVLFTGDLDENLGALLAEKVAVKATILKVPHHGVTRLPPVEFFDLVGPDLVMVPSSRALWVHPRGEFFRQWAISAGVAICHNGINGNVRLFFAREKIEISSDEPSVMCPESLKVER